MATKKQQAKQRGRRRKQARSLAEREEEGRARLQHQNDLNAQVKELYKEKVDAGCNVNRELFSLMATTEALCDQLVDEGLIDRVRLNIARFEHLIKYLNKLEAPTSTQEHDTAEVPA